MLTTVKYYVPVVILVLVLLGSHWLQRQIGSSSSIGQCDLSSGSCLLDSPEGDWGFAISPLPIPIEEPITVTLQLPEGWALLEANITGVNMFMGQIPVVVEQQQGNQITAQTFLGACSEPQMRWQMRAQFIGPNGQTVEKFANFSTDTNAKG